jgi:hypothetical protein
MEKKTPRAALALALAAQAQFLQAEARAQNALEQKDVAMARSIRARTLAEEARARATEAWRTWREAHERTWGKKSLQRAMIAQVRAVRPLKEV